MLTPALCPKCHHQLIVPPSPFYQNTLQVPPSQILSPPPPVPPRNVVLNVEVNLKIELPKLSFADGTVVSKALQCGGGIVPPLAEESRNLDTNSTTTNSVENFTTCIESNSPSPPVQIGNNPFLSTSLENSPNHHIRVDSNPHSTTCLERTSSSNPSLVRSIESTFPIGADENRPSWILESPRDTFSIRLNQQRTSLRQQIPLNIPLSREICQRDLDTLTATVRVLRMSGFYYESITQQQALELLTNKSPGTFLVRNSSNPQHIFALSVQTLKGPTSVRLNYLDGFFYFDCDDHLQEKIAKFPCVIQLIEHYIKSAARPPSGEKEKQQVWLDYFTRKYYSRILLVRPLRKDIPKLQHLCRSAVNRESIPVTNGSIPFSLGCYLKHYPYCV